MTDENQNTSGEPTETTPQFGSGVNNTDNAEPQNTKVEASFGSEDVTKLYKMNRDAQEFIDRLKEETSTMRNEIRTLQEELAKSKTIDDLLDSYNTQQQNDSNSTGPKAPQLDEQELLAKLKDEVFKDMSQAERQRREQENWEESVKLLKDRYGDGFAKYVDERARELDMSNNDMEAMARTQPKAFMELVGGTQKTRNPEPTRASQQSLYSDPSADLEVRYARVARLRRNLGSEEGREAAKQWNDPEFQAQYRTHILEKARREGSKFGNQI